MLYFDWNFSRRISRTACISFVGKEWVIPGPRFRVPQPPCRPEAEKFLENQSHVRRRSKLGRREPDWRFVDLEDQTVVACRAAPVASTCSWRRRAGEGLHARPVTTSQRRCRTRSRWFVLVILWRWELRVLYNVVLSHGAARLSRGRESPRHEGGHLRLSDPRKKWFCPNNKIT